MSLFSIKFRGNIYEITAAVIFVTAYFAIRHFNRGRGVALSYLAVFSGLAVLLNPEIIRTVFQLIGPYWIVRGDSEVRSCAAGAMALVTGVIAVVRIRRSHGALSGIPFAMIGIAGGVLWVGFWIVVLFRFAYGMSHWR